MYYIWLMQAIFKISAENLHKQLRNNNYRIFLSYYIGAFSSYKRIAPSTI